MRGKGSATQAAAAVNQPTAVEIVYVRHGHACHNALKYQATPNYFNLDRLVKRVTFPDPPLTDCGQKLSIANGEILRKKLSAMWGDGTYSVGTSYSLRAIESGLAMFPGKNIHPLPYILEKGPGEGPATIEAQQTYLSGKSDSRRVVWTGVTEGQHRGVSDYKEFLSGLKPSIRKQRAKSTDKQLRLVIVSHSGFIRKSLSKFVGGACSKLHLDNNEGVKVSHDADLMAKGCEPLNGELKTWYTKKSNAASKEYLCPKDYATCMKKAPDRFGAKKGDKISKWIKGPPWNGAACCTD